MPKQLKLPKGWSNPEIIETKPGIFTLGVYLDDDATRRYTEKDRIYMCKLAKRFIELKTGLKIISYEKFISKNKK